MASFARLAPIAATAITAAALYAMAPAAKHPAVTAPSSTKPVPSPAAQGLTSAKATPARSGPEGDIALGAANAPITVIEYASVTCPHCAKWDHDVFPAFKRKYLDTGQVRYILREYTTEPEDAAEAGFMVARCAPPAKYFDVIEAFMANQSTLFDKRDVKGWLVKGGAVGGLSPAQVKACVNDDRGAKAMAVRLEANERAHNIEGTPTFFVNGRLAGDGEVTLAELDKAIEKAQAKPPALRGAQPAPSKPAAKPSAKPNGKAG